jgi:hypothetical protein
MVYGVGVTTRPDVISNVGEVISHALSVGLLALDLKRSDL